MVKGSRRRFIITAFSILGIGGIIIWFSKSKIIRWLLLSTKNKGLTMSLAPNVSEDICILTSSQAEGPFFISSPLRNNLMEDRKGLEMNLKIQIVRAPDCLPIPGAIVEIWHCDAEGVYSGYPEDLAHDPWKTLALAGTGGDNVQPITESRFLRGAQESDAEGMVAFKTIFPGWYDGRAPHIHFKILVDTKEQLTSQFYFEPGFCNQIYLNTAPYDRYGESPFTIHNDIVINEDINAVDGLLLNPTLSQTGMAQAAIKIGIEKLIS